MEKGDATVSDQITYDVFLSHNSSDKPAVELLARRLSEECGLQPFLDKWHLIPGEPWQEALERALDASRTCAVFLGKADLGPWENEEMRAALDIRTTQPDFRVIPVLLPDAHFPERGRLPRFLTRLTWVDFRAGLDDAEAFQRLVCGIQGIAPGVTASEDAAIVCPFRGLQVFDEEHARFFFGRNALTQHLIEQLREDRFLAVLGPSGSGKSSLVRAGVLPQIRNGVLPGSQHWPIVIFKPGAHPLESLASRLLPSIAKGADPIQVRQSLLELLRKDERGLHSTVQIALADSSDTLRFVIVVDQFEEVFTLCDQSDSPLSLINNLLYASTIASGQTIVVITMRADFFGKCALYPELAARLSDRDVLVGPMDGDELRRVMEGPAELVGLHYEKGLVDTILDDLGPEPGSGTLPLLQHTLLELWERRRGQWLTVDAYHEIGGVWGSLAQRADDIYANLTPSQQAAARRVLLRLTQPGEGTEDTRRRATMTELLPYQGQAADIEIVVQKLTDARLLTTSQGESGHEAVEVSHEALIRGWPRLREWINENRADLLIHKQLTEIAAEWDKHQRDPGYLYQGTRFKEIHQWEKIHESDLSQLEQEFLKNCRITQRRGQVKRIGIGLMTSVLAVLIIGVLTMMLAERGPFAPRIVWSPIPDFGGMTVSSLNWGTDRAMYVGFTGGTMNSNVARSRDGGATWEFLDLRGRFVWELLPDPQRADVIYAALGPEIPNLPLNQEDGLYRSQDGGDSWTQIDNDLPIPIVGALEASPTGVLYAGSSDYTTPTQVYASSDQGATWSPLQDSPKAAVYLLNWIADRLLIGTTQGLWQWTEDGRWVHLLKEERVAVMAAVGAEDVVFAGGTGIFELRNGREPRKISDERVRTLDMTPGSPPSFVASTTGGTIVQWGLDAQIRTIAYHDVFGKATFIYFVRVQPDISGQFWVGTNNGLYQGKMKRWFEELWTWTG